MVANDAKKTQVSWQDSQIRLTEAVSVLVGADNGRYPSGNTVLVEGSGETVLIDPSIAVVERGGVPVAVDAVVNSHGHEDHIAGNALFSSARLHIHHDDLPAVQSMEGLMNVYGLQGQAREDFSKLVAEEFFYQAREDAQGFADGHIFDLGRVRIEAMHLPGHTRGHSGFRIGNVFFLSDIDLTGFGPYYGDAWSDLDQFDESLDKVREVDADWYVTFHHKGIIEGRETFVEMVDGFQAVIGRRHEAMLDYLVEPRSLDDMVAHRFVYRPHVEHIFANSVERRTAELHIGRMIERGEAIEVEPDRFQRI